MPYHEVPFLVGGLFCGIILVLFIVSILIAIWVYRDAEKRGMSGVLWLIVVLVAGLIGLIIYFVVRKPLQPVMPPGYVMAPVVPGYGYPPPMQPMQQPMQPQMPMAQPGGAWKYCSNCGNQVAANAPNCPRCGAKIA